MSADATLRPAMPRQMPPRDVLTGLRRGIEKESLRVRPDGTLATTPHPARLGSALTHPHITTDFSESQLELITGVHASAEACLDELTEIHQVVYRAIGDELLWAREHAVPACRPTTPFRSAATAPPTSAARRASTAWACRIATAGACRRSPGIHYNFSLPDAASATTLLRADPQLPPPFLAAALPVRRIARGVLDLRRRPRARARSA